MKIRGRIILAAIICMMSSFLMPIGAAKPDQLAIVVADRNSRMLLRAAQVFKEEAGKRTHLDIPVIFNINEKRKNLVIIGIEGQMGKLDRETINALQAMNPTGKEGFKIVTGKEGSVIIAGHDEAGAFYGMGWLLRKITLLDHRIIIPGKISISSTPIYPIRGHQLGYRPKTNAYDAWTVKQFDSYIRDLAVFGANSIEIMPPRTDDDPTSANMKMPAIRMIAEQSRICRDYRLNVWMWYPNMGSDYTTPDSVRKELAEREQIFRVLPKLDALFVPGGDPGELEPDQLFEWLGKVAAVLRKYHPKAKIWVSPQAFKPTPNWYDDFYRNINKKYNWLGGVVYGPWIRTPLPEVRELIGPSVPIRLYPDITHSLSCQYPVPDWDLAYAMTLGRECINPRPVDEQYIHNFYAPLASGSISYSEGTNDDVNKFVWTGQDWDPSTPVIETLRDYGRYFIGPDYTENIAQGLLSLELDFRGPLISNDQVEKTLFQWRDMERNAPQEVLSNPRFQSGLLRACFDAYVQRRLRYENSLEMQAKEVLENAKKTGSADAIRQAREILTFSRTKPVAQELKLRCLALADSLYRSFGEQLTVGRHHAAEGRGNFIDNIDIPLNDALWILDQLNEAEKYNEETQRLDAIYRILHRTDPGPGGFYDNFGQPSAWKRVKSEKTWAEDPGSLESPRVSFGVGLKGEDWVHEVVAKGFEGQSTPLAWMNQINTLYDTPLEIEYDHLDTSAYYILRISYTGRFRSNMKLTANGVKIHDYIQTGNKPVYEFHIPKEVTSNGIIHFTWTCGPDRDGEGERGAQVSEIWLIRNSVKPK